MADTDVFQIDLCSAQTIGSNNNRAAREQRVRMHETGPGGPERVLACELEFDSA
jgi:hypothetical protein